MGNSLLRLLPLFAAFLLPHSAVSQKSFVPVGSSRSLTLNEAVALALAQNPDILQARQEIERISGQYIEVRAQALPRAEVVSSYEKRDPNLQSSSPFGGTQDESWRVALQGRQLLYSGGQVTAALRIARAAQESAIYQLQDTIDRVIATTRQEFYAIILNRALIGVREESLDLLQQELNDQNARFEAGTVPRFNVLRAEVELANARPDLIRARNDYRIAQLNLARTLGVNTTGVTSAANLPFEIKGELSAAPRSIDVAEAIRLAKERRPFLKAQRQNILIEAQQIRVENAGYLPRLDGLGGYEARNDQTSENLDDALKGWFLGLEGSWKIFDGLETAGKVKQARARLESARIVYEDSVRQVELEVQTALSRLLEARELIDSQAKTVEQAKEALRLSRERVSAGAGTQLEVLDARVALTQAQTTELQAVYDYNVALAEYERATAIATGYEDRFRDPLAVRVSGK